MTEMRTCRDQPITRRRGKTRASQVTYLGLKICHQTIGCCRSQPVAVQLAQGRAGERLGLGPAHAGLEAWIVEQADHQPVAFRKRDMAAGVAEDRVRLRVEVVHETKDLRGLLQQARSEEQPSELPSLMRN